MKRVPAVLVLAGLLTSTGAAAAQHASLASATSGAGAGGVFTIPEGPADSLYRLGRQAVADADYRRAEKLFKQVVDKYPKSQPAGDALYWRAWSLYRIGAERGGSRADLEAAIDALDQQRKGYASATTAGDAPTLRAQILAAQASLGDARAAGAIATEAKGLSQQRSCSGSNADEQARLAAIEGLLQMNAEDAIPILKDVLKQRDPCRAELRKRAVFLIAQKRARDVVATLLDVARNDPSSEVREDAVFWLGRTGAEQAIPALDSILFTGGDEEIRKKAVFALSQQGGDQRARDALRRAALDERLPAEVRSDAVYWLGNAKLVDLDFFKTMFSKTRDADLRDKIIFSVSQSSLPQASAWLLDLARDKTVDVQSRKTAIFHLSQRRAIDLDGLASIFDQAKGNEEIQNQILFVYSQRSEPAAIDKLIAVAKSDADIEVRKQAIFWLSHKDDPRAKQFIRDLLKP